MEEREVWKREREEEREVWTSIKVWKRERRREEGNKRGGRCGR